MLGGLQTLKRAGVGNKLHGLGYQRPEAGAGP